MLPCGLLESPVVDGQNHPRPRPTTIHFSRGPGSNLCIFTLVCTPVCLTGVLSLYLALGRSAARFAAAPDNSFSVYCMNQFGCIVQLLNIRPYVIFIFGREELGDGDTANPFSFA